MLALSGSALVGCTPETAPAPSPTTAFASEEEAFAAAEETYRSYNDALNAVDPADPTTFEAVFAFSTGDFQNSDKENLSIMNAEHLTISGENKVSGFKGLSSSSTLDSVLARVCVDVSEVTITDPTGASRVDPNRPITSIIDVTFVDRDGEFLIESATRSEASTCE